MSTVPTAARRSPLARMLSRAVGGAGVVALLVVAVALGTGPGAAPGSEALPSGTTLAANPFDVFPPATPKKLAVDPLDSALAVSWQQVNTNDLLEYRVYLDGASSPAATVPAGTTATTLGGLVNGRSYAVQVSAADVNGNESSLTTAVYGTPADMTPPAAPTGLVAERGDGSVTLTWDPNGEPDVATYRVLLDGRAGGEVGAGSTSVTVPGLVNDVEHVFALVAVDTAGNASPASAQVRATPTDLTAPAAPTGLTAAPEETAAVLTWDAVPDADVARYVVLADDGSVVADVAAPDTSVRVAGLATGVPVRFTVVAVDGHGNTSLASAAVEVVPADVTPPEAPGSVVVTPAPGELFVSWDPVATPDVAAYRVLLDGQVVRTVDAGTTLVGLPGLEPGRSYVVTVVAVDAARNESSASVALDAVPSTPPSTAAATGAGAESGLAATRDGRWAVLGTRERLEPGDTNDAYELYLLDRVAGTARRVAPLPAGWTSRSTDVTNTSAVALSEDGRYLALTTTARLVAADTNVLADVYRLDLASGTWDLVSVPASGAVSASVAGTVLQPGPSVYSTRPSVAMSADGDRVLFYSARPDLLAGNPAPDRNGGVDLFAKDLGTGEVLRVSSTATWGDLPRGVLGPAVDVTPDGRYAVFPATSTRGPVVAMRKDLVTGELVTASTTRPTGSTTSAEVEVGVFRDAGDLAVSDDGRYVALSTAAKVGTATPGASWSTGLAYRKDLLTGAMEPLGTGQTGAWEHQVALDATGRYAFFATAAAALPLDGNGHTDVYRRDLATGDLALVTARADGTAGPPLGGSITPAEYGPVVVLSAHAVVVGTSQPLVAGDANGLRDVYRKDLGTGVVHSLTP